MASTAAAAPPINWYERQNELEPGMIFTRHWDDEPIMLDRRVPADGTRWYVATWSGGSWAYYDDTAEPGDLLDRLPDNWAGNPSRAAA